jgi:hypothetical protein
MNVYYFGPLGRLMRMDVPDRGFVNSPVELGAFHTGLSGRRTRDVFGYRRTLAIPLVGLTNRALSFFEACFFGAIAGPFYLWDPRHSNRLTASTSGGAWPQIGVWSPSIGVVTRTASTATLLTCATPDGTVNMPAPSYTMTWVSGGAGTLGTEPGVYIPVVPGEQLVFSAYVVSGAPTLELVPYSAALVAGTPATGTVTLAETPARRYVPYTVPGDGSVVAVRAQLRVATSTTVVSTAWQVSTPQDDGTPDPWVLGTGVPQVLIEDFPEASERARHLVGATISLLEA